MLTAKDVQELQTKLQAKLDECQAELGFGFTVYAGKYDPKHGHVFFKVQANQVDAETGKTVSMEAQAFLDKCKYYGLQRDDLGRTIESGGVQYKIAGLLVRCKKLPILCERVSDGIRFKFDAFSVQCALQAGRRTDSSELLGKYDTARRTEADILNDLRSVECALSPENLTCDGILSAAQVATNRRRLESQKRALVNELGRQPTDAELYS